MWDGEPDGSVGGCREGYSWYMRVRGMRGTRYAETHVQVLVLGGRSRLSSVVLTKRNLVFLFRGTCLIMPPNSNLSYNASGLRNMADQPVNPPLHEAQQVRDPAEMHHIQQGRFFPISARL